MIPRLRKSLSPEQFALLRRAGELAERQGLGLFLVGGSVRDAALGVTCRDLDLVTVGDGIAFARRLADDLGAEIRPMRKYLTAWVRIADAQWLDVATARTETYARPAAMPAVTPAASIGSDLGRRDFSFNAMAVDLAPGNFGVLRDDFGGRRDLAAGVIRVLHPGSFRDDPTRIYRAARYAIRLGLRLEPETDRVLREALAAGHAARLSRPRLAKELGLIRTERDPRAVLRLLAAWGAPLEGK